MSVRFRPALLAGAIATVSGAAVAETAPSDAAPGPIEEIRVTGQLSGFGATRSATPILETARSVAVIDEDEFRSRGALSLDDTLNYTAGVVGDTFGFSTRGDFPRVRGFDSAEYRDGQQVLFGFYNNTRSDVYMLEQVEVLKGPASVLFGKGTPGGIVNAISKVARPGVDDEVVVDAGTHDRYQVSADVGAEIGSNWHARLVGVYRDAETQVDEVTDDALILMPSVSWVTDRTRLTAMVELSDRDSDTAHQFLPINATGCASGDVSVTPASFCANATAGEIDASTYLGQPGFNRYDTDSTLVSLLGSHQFNEWASLEGVIRWKDGEADYRQSWIDFLGAGNPRIDASGAGGRTFYRSNATSEQLAMDLRARFEFATGALEHELFAGLVYQDVETDNDTLFLSAQGTLDVTDPVYGPTPTSLTDGTPLFDGATARTEDRAVYLNDQISIDRWRFNLGVRLDDVENDSGGSSQGDDETSFSAGVLYAFDNGLSPYASFAESFEPVVGNNSVTGEPLKPREGEQWELGLKYQPPGTRTYVTVAWFDIEESNLPNPSSLVTSPDQQQEGVGEVQGIEIEAQTRLGDWYLEGAYTKLDTESAEGVEFASVPEEQASAWIAWEPSADRVRGLRLGLGVRHVGENSSTSVPAGVRVETDGYTVVDALIGYTRAQWEATLNLRNLGDEAYYGTCLARGDCFPGEERTVVARLTRRF
jgi:iron complex outermembrane receptor protein